jgi:hypothetical protein
MLFDAPLRNAARTFAAMVGRALTIAARSDERSEILLGNVHLGGSHRSLNLGEAASGNVRQTASGQP